MLHQQVLGLACNERILCYELCAKNNNVCLIKTSFEKFFNALSSSFSLYF